MRITVLLSLFYRRRRLEDLAGSVPYPDHWLSPQAQRVPARRAS